MTLDNPLKHCFNTVITKNVSIYRVHNVSRAKSETIIMTMTIRSINSITVISCIRA